MKADDIKRLNFYERQFLTKQDFQDEQAYHIEMRRRHLIAQHTWGIVVGLEIAKDKTSEGWSVQSGMAVDGFGREIIVFDPIDLDVNKIKSQLGTGTTPMQLKIWLAYRVEKADQPTAGYEVCDQPDQFTRIRETFRLIYQDNPPTKEGTISSQPHEALVEDPSVAPWPIYLGTITCTFASGASKPTITEVDSTEHRYIGLTGAEITPPQVAQNLPPGTSPLKTTLTLRAEETKITGLKTTTPGHLIVDGDVQIDGKVGIGTTTPNAPLHVQGDRIRLENTGKRLVLAAEGGAVDLQTDTNDLYIRATGHDVVINPLSNDGKVGIGMESPSVQLHVQDSKSGSADITDHVALIENTSTTDNADVLALKVGINQPEGSNNFITFFGGNNNNVGRIEGNGSGVFFGTTSGDYAECLPRLNEEEAIAPAEIVGIFAGKVTKATDKSHHTAVVSNQSIVIGNMPQQEEKHLYEDIAFLGQVPVRIRGKVKAGNYIIPSGLNDGTGIAVSPKNLTPEPDGVTTSRINI